MKSQFFPNRVFNLVARSSRKQTAWDFCPVVQQLVQLFNFWHAWHVCNFLSACKPRATREIQSWVPTSLHNLEQFFTLFHTLPSHDSHLNTRLLIAKIQANLARNKTNKMIDKIQPYSTYGFFFYIYFFNFNFFFYKFLSLKLYQLNGWNVFQSFCVRYIYIIPLITCEHYSYLGFTCCKRYMCQM